MNVSYWLVVYFLFYFAIAFVARSWLTWRRTGINPFVLGNSESAHDFVGKLFRLVVLAVALAVALNAFAPAAMQWLTPILWLEHGAVAGLGWLLLIGTLLWIALAQVQMGNSWRIGIDTNRKTELIQQGLFGVSRNPIFLGMRLNLLGFFLIMPNAVTLTILVAGDILVQIQVRLEEEYLRQLHGAAYNAYCQQVRRWL